MHVLPPNVPNISPERGLPIDQAMAKFLPLRRVPLPCPACREHAVDMVFCGVGFGCGCFRCTECDHTWQEPMNDASLLGLLEESALPLPATPTHAT